MDDVTALTGFFERKLQSEFLCVIVSSGPDLRMETKFDEVMAEDIAKAPFSDFASTLREHAHADAKARGHAGPYYVWIVRAGSDGAPTKPFERFPLTFPDCVSTPEQQLAGMLSEQRALSTEQGKLVLQFAELGARKNTEYVEQLRDDVSRERVERVRDRDYIKSLNDIVHATTLASSEALIQGDARRETARAAAERKQIVTAMLGNVDIILPALASGWMRANGAGGGTNFDAVAEYKLISDFVTTLRPEQFAAIGAKLPQHLRMGLMQIYNGQIAPPLIPMASAKLFGQIDMQLMMEIYGMLEPVVKRDVSHEQRPSGGECPVCRASSDAPCNEPSDQQRMFMQLMETRQNTLLARGEAAMKQLTPGATGG